MFDFIYVEDEVANCPRTQNLVRRFPRAKVVGCRRYSEIFNRGGQDFRLQKQNPALILAAKHGQKILPAPEGFGIGSNHNFYFSHMLNCLYDCRYCFLQGMYRSAHMVLFVNYNSFKQEIEKLIATPDDDRHSPLHFFTGYDCDSLAMESVTGFVDAFLPFFSSFSEAVFELRTKSVHATALLKTSSLQNVVVAYSLTPTSVAAQYEKGVPSPASRIAAAARLQAAGWPIGLRFDPVIYHEEFRDTYRQLFADTFAQVAAERIHSISIGTLRLPRVFHSRMESLYPEEALFAQGLEDSGSVVGYTDVLHQEIVKFCTDELKRYVAEDVLYPCGSFLSPEHHNSSSIEFSENPLKPTLESQ